MKKLILAGAFLLFSAAAMAQVDKDDDAQPNDDQLQQQPAREVRDRVETTAQRQATVQTNNSKVKSESEFQAEKRAKDKGRTQKQTSAERPVSDTVKRVRTPKPQIQDAKPRK